MVVDTKTKLSSGGRVSPARKPARVPPLKLTGITVRSESKLNEPVSAWTVRMPNSVRQELRRFGFEKDLQLNEVCELAFNAFLDAEPSKQYARAHYPLFDATPDELAYLMSAWRLLRSTDHPEAREILIMLLRKWPDVSQKKK